MGLCTGFSEHPPSCMSLAASRPASPGWLFCDQPILITVKSCIHFMIEFWSGELFFFLLPVSNFQVAPVTSSLDFHSFLLSLCFFSHTCSKVYQRKHLPSQGWPPHCDRLIQVEWTSFRQRTLIIMKALRTQCELTSDRPFPASSALS